MANSLSEGFIRGTYTGASGIHHFILPINFDGTPTPGTEPLLTKKGAGTILAEAGLQAFLDVYGTLFNDDTQFGLAEAYTVDPDTEERGFVWGWDMDFLGLSSQPNVPLGMATMTFKTIVGGLLKVVAMEGAATVNTKEFSPFPSGSNLTDLSDYVTGTDSIVIGRDNAYAFASISFTVKTSDALRKRVGLS